MSLFFKKNLQGKIILITSVTIFIFISLSFLFEHTNYKKMLYKRLIIHMRENSFSIRTSIETAPETTQVQSILERFALLEKEEHASDNGDVDPYEIPPHEIHVVDKAGIITASTKPELNGIPIEEALHHSENKLHDVLEGRIKYAIEHMEHSGVKVIDMSIPIRKNGNIIGALHYVEPYLKLDRLIRDSFLQHAFFAIGLIFSLSLSINYLLKKMVTKPLSDISNEMNRITLKEHGKHIEISSEDEIGRLIQSFNDMSSALKGRENELRSYTSKLEDMVKERTRKLEESHAQLVQTEKLASMGKFAGYTAHEINNPIGIISARAECILMDAKEKGYPGYLLKDIAVIKKHSDRIATIIEGMLTFSRKSRAEFTELDIQSIIDETVLLLEHKFSANNINILNKLSCCAPKVLGNSTQMQQVFFNLLSNSMDSMPDGGAIRIQCDCNDSGFVDVSISDTGTGIKDEHVNYIFDPFFTTKQDGKGTGLGLSVTYGIIEEHHGQISVKSEIGEGTTFHIILPVKQDHVKQAGRQ